MLGLLVCVNVGEYAIAILMSLRELLPENGADPGRVWAPGEGIGDERGQGQVPMDPARVLVSPDLKRPPNVTWAF